MAKSLYFFTAQELYSATPQALYFTGKDPNILGYPFFDHSSPRWATIPDKLTLGAPKKYGVGVQVVYTLDGTNPTKYSTKYNQPIVLTKGKTTVVRAALLKDGKIGPIKTQVYKNIS